MKLLQDYVDLHKNEIEQKLQSTISTKISQDLKIPIYNDALARLLQFSTGGKMMRGILVLLSAEMFGAKFNDSINIAAAIELAHSGLLIHDDIIDDDKLRRGEKTIFAQFAEGQNKFYGQSIAICVGDIAFFLSTQLIAQSSLAVDKKNQVQDYFSNELLKVGAAEMEDFHFGATDDEPSMDQILNMYKLKSARYTFSLPFVIGAIISGQNSNTISTLEKFGESLGIVFQIVDDALGITGDSKITGKPVGNDIKQNKKTVYRKLLYNVANGKQKEILDSIFGKSNITDEDVKKVIEIANTLQIQQKIDTLIYELSNDARETLKNIQIPEEYKKILEELIEYNLSRNK